MAGSSKWREIIENLKQRKAAASQMGGEEKLDRHQQQGKENARTRIEILIDEGTFTEIGNLVSGDVDAFVAGVGMIDGRPVAIGSEDFTVKGGSIGRAESAKRYRIAEIALQERIPLIMLLEGAGHRPPLPDDPPTTRTPGDLQAQADASGRIPFAAVVLGPSAGHGALSAPLADFSIMTQKASIFTAGPPLVKASLGEEITKEELGGPDVALQSGVIHNLADNDEEALIQVRKWLSYLPSSAWQHPPRVDQDTSDRSVEELLEIIPDNPRHSYDMKDVIQVIMDKDSFFEIQPVFGPSLITGFARLGGRSVAIVANQPNHLAGSINVDAADKATQFIQVADAFHVPLIFLTDNPGVLAGSVSEKAGILRHAGRMFLAQHHATVPKIQLTLRKAYGFGSTAMGMNPFDGQTLNLAYPGVSFGAMPARGADEATGADEQTKAALREAELSSGYRSAASLSIDDVIDPAETRNMLLSGLQIASARLENPVSPKSRTFNLG